MSEKRNFLDLQAERMKQSVEAKGFGFEEANAETKKLKILRFEKNQEKGKDNVIARIDKVITFIHWDYRGEAIQAGDAWLCSVSLDTVHAVYYAIPLMRITGSLILGLDEALRNDVLSELFEANRDEFEKVFDERIRDEITKMEYERAKSEYERTIGELEEQVGALKSENEKLTVLSRRFVDTDDEIELFSESGNSEEVEITADVLVAKSQKGIPRISRPVAPGMPAFKTNSFNNSESITKKFRVERRSDETIYCEDFTDARYFVHISPNGKYLVVRPDEHGSVFSYEKYKIRLDGLGKFSSFSERYDMVAEYSDFYGGLLIHLQPPARTD